MARRNPSSAAFQVTLCRMGETMRVRQSVLSSFCAWLVKRGGLPSNPVARLDRPAHRREAPKQVPGSAIMDALVQAARQRGRPAPTTSDPWVARHPKPLYFSLDLLRRLA